MAAMRRRLVLSSLIFGLLVGAVPSWGLTRLVPSEYPTIQAGLDASASGDTVLVAPGTYTHVEVRDFGAPVTSCVFMVDGVILKSEEGPGATTIEMLNAPGPQAQVMVALDIGSPATAIEGFTITTPLLTRGLYLLGRLTCRDCVFRDLNVGESTGGGIAGNGDLTLIGCEFVNCRAFGGGAIYHSNGGLEMYDCYVHDCGSVALQLSGIGDLPPESAHIEGCTFADNWNNAGGGGALGISQYDGGITIRGCRFENNEDRGTGGGGIAHGYVGTGSVIENCLFLNNRTIGPNGIGGGIRVGGTVTVRGCTFWGNSSPTGSGGDAIGFFATGSHMQNNIIAACIGQGAVHAYQANLQSSCNVFWQNAGGQGRYYTPGPTDRIVDPLLCDPVVGDFELMAGSPCLPPGSIGCGLIGAFGEGNCGVISVDPTTWGEMKAAYRGEEGGGR